MNSSGIPIEPYCRGASPSLLPMAAMGGQVDSFDGSQAENLQLFLPLHSYGRSSQLSQSNSTNSSQYSVPCSNLAFENYGATSTSTSSFESGWSNGRTESTFVSIEQYRSLQARFHKMRQEHGDLVKQRDLLEAKHLALREAYEHLVQRIPDSFHEHISLKRENYPNITYWFRHEYFAAVSEDKITSIDNAPVKAQGAELNEVDDEDNDQEDGLGVGEQSSGAPKGKRGKGRASQGENVKMRYIQHENGDVIDGWRAAEIRRYARSIFVGFALEGKVFQSWAERVDMASRISFYRHMVVRFPELGFCELDWKSEQIAIEIYSQWRGQWMNKQELEKTKGRTSLKRLVEDNWKDDSSSKKTKISMSRSESALPDLLAVDLSDSVPQIDIIADTPAKLKQAPMGQVTIGNQFLAVNPTGSDACPQYQFSINNPFSVAPFPLAPSSFSTLANPVHPSQSFSNPGQHMHLSQSESSQEDAQKVSKRPNKMRVNKHSTTPRNLCAKEWVEKHHGTVDEFATYFLALPAKELERFQALSKSLSGGKNA